jgi:hypothetical protein
MASSAATELRDFLAYRRRAGIAQQRRYAQTIADFHRHIKIAPWDDAKPEQCRDWTDKELERVGPSAASFYALNICTFLKHRMMIRERTLPNAFRLAFDAGENEDKKNPPDSRP